MWRCDNVGGLGEQWVVSANTWHVTCIGFLSRPFLFLGSRVPSTIYRFWRSVYVIWCVYAQGGALWGPVLPRPFMGSNPQNPNYRGMNRLLNAFTHTHTRLTALCRGLPGWAGTRKVKPIWILLKQETVSGSGISWAICKLAPRFSQITTPAPHHSVFYRPDALPAAQPTASKHWS